MADLSKIIVLPLRKLVLFGVAPNGEEGEFKIMKFVEEFKKLERMASTKNKDKENKVQKCELNNMTELAEYETFKNLTSHMIEILKKEDESAFLESLKEAYNIKYSCKEYIILCLAVATKRNENSKLVSGAYALVPELCSSSSLLFLFLQFNKLLAQEKKGCGWGRGLRKAIKNWYLKWDPSELALEVTRYSRAFSWSHKDIIRLSHLKIKDLPEGTQAVLNYVCFGLDNTKEKYKEKTPEIIDLIQKLYPETNANKVEGLLEKGKSIAEKHSVILRDFPFSHFQPEVINFLINHLKASQIAESLHQPNNLLREAYLDEKFGATLLSKIKDETFAKEIDAVSLLVSYNSCRSKAFHISYEKSGRESNKKWKKNAAPEADKEKKQNLISLPEQLCPIIDALSGAITKHFENGEKPKKGAAVFVDMSKSMQDFIYTNSSDSTKQVRAIHAATLILMGLSQNEWETVCPFIFAKTGVGKIYIPTPVAIHFLRASMKNIVDGPIDVKAAIDKCLEIKKETCIIICRSIDSDFVKAVKDSEKNFKGKIRLIVCTFATKGKLDLSSICDDAAFIVGFTERTLPFVQAFHERIV